MPQINIKNISLENAFLKRVVILVNILLIGFTIRYMTAHEVLFDPDSYIWYRIAAYFSGLDTRFFVEKDGLTLDLLGYYPTYRYIEQYPLGLPLAIGYTFKLLSYLNLVDFTKEGLMKYFFFFGSITGALTGIAGYLIVREIFKNEKIAFAAALFYVVSVASFTRNTAGDCGQESLGGLLIFLWIFLAIKAFKQRFLSKEHIIYTVASGVSSGLASATWGGNEFYLGVFGLSYVLYMLIIGIKREIENKESMFLSYPVIIFLTLLVRDLISPLRYSLLPKSVIYLILYLGIFLALLYLATIRIKIDVRLSLAGAFIIFLVAFSAFYGIDAIITTVKSAIKSYIHGKKSLTGETVAYYRMSTLKDFKDMFGLMLLFIPVGLAYLAYEFYRERRFGILFIIIWTILGILAFRYMIRLHFFLALPVPLLTLLTINFFVKKSTTDESFRKIAIVFLFVLVFAPTVTDGAIYAKLSKNNDLNVLPWKDAGEWIKEHTEPNALLIHWWDYGYYLQTFAERTTIVDGGNFGPQVIRKEGNRTIIGDPNRNVDVAKFFCSEEGSYYEKHLYEVYNPENRPVYILVSVEEFPKSGAINYHAKDNIYYYRLTLDSTGDIKIDSKRIENLLNSIKPTGRYTVREEEDRYIVLTEISIGRGIIPVVIEVNKTGNRTLDMEKIKKEVENVGLVDFAVIPAGKFYIIWVQIGKKEWGNKLLTKFLPFQLNGGGKGLKNYELVYTNGYVYIYKYKQSD